MRLIAIFLGVAISVEGRGQEPPPGLRIPAEVRARRCVLFEIRAETSAAKVIWELPEGIDGRAFGDGRTLVAVAQTSGRFAIRAIAAKDSEPLLARCVVIVESPPQPDIFVAEIQSAYAATPDPAGKSRLIELYAQAVAYCQNPEIATAGRLAEVVRKAGETLLGDRTRLASVRNRVGQELASKVGGDADTPLTPASREAAAGIYRKASKALEAINP
jgi:hypothetical protein